MWTTKYRSDEEHEFHIHLKACLLLAFRYQSNCYFGVSNEVSYRLIRMVIAKSNTPKRSKVILMISKKNNSK